MSKFSTNIIHARRKTRRLAAPPQPSATPPLTHEPCSPLPIPAAAASNLHPESQSAYFKYFKSLWRKSFKFFTTLCQSPQAPYNYIVSTNISITKYCKNGQLNFARNLFDEMPRRTVVSWNTMISGYSKWWQYYEALKLTSIMHGSNIKLNETTF